MLNLTTMAYEKLFEYINHNSSKFEDGRVNYRTSRINLVLGVIIMRWNSLLILKRSQKVLTYSGMRDFVGGYLDDGLLPEEKVMEEIQEELWIDPFEVLSIRRFRRIVQYDDVINKVRVNFPMLIMVKPDVSIVLDDEHTEYNWISWDDLHNYDLVPWTLDLYNYIETFSSFY